MGGNITKAMLEANYSPNTANTPQKLTESKGFKDLMKQYGLTEQLITTSLVEDIKAKPQKRVEELKLGAKVLRMVDEDREPPQQPEITIIKEQKNIYMIVNESEEKIRKELET
jgi:hypothetical protein